MTSYNLKSKTINSIKWSAVERFSVQFFQFIFNIFLARLVLPSEYGLIALITVFLSIGQIFVDSGLVKALIQKQDRNEIDFSTVFYFNILISLILYIFLFIASPYIAIFYKLPTLELLCKLLGINLIIQSFSVVQIAKFNSAFDFKTQAKASLISVILSGLFGVLLAYLDYGVWALLVQSLSYNFLNTCLLWIYSRWIPKFLFSIHSLISLVSYGSRLLFSGLLHTVYFNIFSLLIGRYYSAIQVGYFNQSTLIARFPSVSFMAVFTRAIFPIQCEIQDNNDLLRASYFQYLKMSTYVVFPIMIFLAILSKPLILIVLSDKWLPMADYFRILCLAYMLDPLMVLNSQLLHVKGRTDLFFKAELVKKFFGILIIIFTISYGMKAICLGILIYNILDILVIIYYSKPIIQIGYLEQFKAVGTNLFMAIIMGIFIYFSLFLNSNAWLQLLMGSALGLSVYYVMGKLLRVKELNFLIRTIRNFFN